MNSEVENKNNLPCWNKWAEMGKTGIFKESVIFFLFLQIHVSNLGPTRTDEYGVLPRIWKYINKRGREALVTEREILKNRFFHFPAALPWLKAAATMRMWTPADRKGQSGSWSARRWCLGPWALPLPPTLCVPSPRSLSPSTLSSPTTTTILLLRSSIYLFFIFFCTCSLSTRECVRTITHFYVLIYLLSL